MFRHLCIYANWLLFLATEAIKLAEALFEHGRRDLVEHLCKMIRRVLRSDVQIKTPPKTKGKSRSTAPLPVDGLTSDQVYSLCLSITSMSIVIIETPYWPNNY